MSYLPSLSLHNDHDIALNGTSAYRINDNRVTITIDEIANNREPGNLSGTLSIELWALSQPYQGQGFSGVALAATTIGEINGNHFLSNCQYDLVFNAPPAGNWHLVLMIREWENGTYITRDYINFAMPYNVDGNRSGVRVTREESNNVISVAFKEKAEAVVPAKPEKGMDEIIAKKPASRKVVAEPKKVVEDGLISVNKAHLKEIEAIKGVSKKLAKSIVDGRPYKDLEELIGVKGMGKKLLDKIRSTLKI